MGPMSKSIAIISDILATVEFSIAFQYVLSNYDEYFLVLTQSIESKKDIRILQIFTIICKHNTSFIQACIHPYKQFLINSFQGKIQTLTISA